MKKCIVILFCLLLLGCSREHPNNKIIIREANDELGHYIKYTDGEYNYIENIETKSVITSGIVSSTEPRLRLSQEKLQTTKDSDDVMDYILVFNATETSPNTYNIMLSDGSKIVNSMLSSSWVLLGEYANNEYIDMYLSRNNNECRIILFKNKIKIFQNLSGKSIDSWTYINEKEG